MGIRAVGSKGLEFRDIETGERDGFGTGFVQTSFQPAGAMILTIAPSDTQRVA